MRRSYFAFLNFATALLFAVATTAVGFVVTPLLLGWLGEERFGAARMLTGFFAYLSLLEFGLGGAVSPLLARAIHRGDQPAVASTLAAAFKAYARTASLSIVFGLALTFVIWRFHLVDVSSQNRRDLVVASLVSVVGFLMVPCIPFRSLLDARQNGFIINAILIFQCLLVAIASVLFASHGGGITGQAAATALGTAGFYAIVVFMARKHAGGFIGAARTPSAPGTKTEIRNLSLPTLVINISGRLSIMSDELIIGMIRGVALVPSFFIYQRLAALAKQQLEGMGGAVWAGMAGLYVQGRLEEFRASLLTTTKTLCVLGAGALAPIVAYNDVFVRLWVGTSPSRETMLICPVAALNAILVSLNSLWGWTFSGTGKVRLISAQAAIGTVVNLVVSVVLTKALGLAGPLLGTTVAYLALPLWYLPMLMKREFGVSIPRLALAALVPATIGCLMAAVLFTLRHNMIARGWISLLAEMAAAGTCTLAMAFAFSFNRDERMMWLARARWIAARLTGARRGALEPD